MRPGSGLNELSNFIAFGTEVAEVIEVAIGHVVDPVTFYVYARDTPPSSIEMEEELKVIVCGLNVYSF